MNSPKRIIICLRRISTSTVTASPADKKCPRNPECQPRPVKKQNLLVYDKSNPCYGKAKPVSYRILPIRVAQAKKIKVCTGADLKRMCEPKLCDCPKKRRRRFGLITILSFLTKVAVASFLVYFTFNQGFWGRSSDTEQLYIRICKFIRKPSSDELKRFQEEELGKTCGNKPISCDPFIVRERELKHGKLGDSELTADDMMRQKNWCQGVPDLGKMANCIKKCWNRGVLKSFAIVTGTDTSWRQRKKAEVKINPYCPVQEQHEEEEG